ncbi:MAG: hypothetical protein R3B48_02230 [Kofleriaceae bacterium]
MFARSLRHGPSLRLGGRGVGMAVSGLGLAVLLAGCPADNTCEVDADCGGEVCARSKECLPASLVHRVEVRWTIAGQAPGATTCASVEPLGIEFLRTPKDALRYEPVVCAAGLFTIDKLPTRMDEVILSGPRVVARAGIGLAGVVMLDLR